MTRLDETAAFQRGRAGELVVAQLLIDAGYYVLPAYEYSGRDSDKAPAFIGATDSFVIPDLDIARHGKRGWVEVKTKARATWTRMTSRYEHGLPLRHWEHYGAIAAITGTPVYLCIYEEATGDVLIENIDILGPHRRESRMRKDGHAREFMVYLPRDAFRLFSHVEPKDGESGQEQLW